MTQPITGLRIGGTLLFPRLDFEASVDELAALGFAATDVHLPQIGASVAYTEAHAAAAATRIHSLGMVVSGLSVTGDATFDPFGGIAAVRSTSEGLSRHIRLAAAMGAPRVMIWDGTVGNAEDARYASGILAECIARAVDSCGIADPPTVCVEPHPFTFALRFRLLDELAHSLAAVGAELCLDFSHFSVAWGSDFMGMVHDDVLKCVGLIHYCDSDCTTSELHYPPGEGRLDLVSISAKLAGRGLPALWDLYSWPAPRAAIQRYMETYDSFLATQLPADAKDASGVRA